jgi:hypothetical protein
LYLILTNNLFYSLVFAFIVHTLYNNNEEETQSK